jgi:hypothetical protein
MSILAGGVHVLVMAAVCLDHSAVLRRLLLVEDFEDRGLGALVGRAHPRAQLLVNRLGLADDLVDDRLDRGELIVAEVQLRAKSLYDLPGRVRALVIDPREIAVAASPQPIDRDAGDRACDQEQGREPYRDDAGPILG